MVQSIVYIPANYVSTYSKIDNSPGYYDYTGIYIPWYSSYDSSTLYYYVTPASMASIIAQNYNKDLMDVLLCVSYPGNSPSVSRWEVLSVNASSNGSGIIQITIDNRGLRQEKYSGFNAFALYVKDTRYTDGTDYMTTFTPVRQAIVDSPQV